MATPFYPKFHTYKHKPFSFMVRKKASAISAPPAVNGYTDLAPAARLKETIDYNARPEEGTLHIRLLRLYPAASGDALLGSIIESKISIVDRESNQQFEALSYCWGPHPKNESEWKSISIVDSENDQYSLYAIRTNLDAALRRLRNKKNRFRYLWIDAICIDQSNNNEKSQQIPLMDRIFQEASRVCIWLGDDKNQDNDVIALEHIRKIIKLEGFENLIKSSYTNQWAALASLMKREWFGRRWVVQEIAYARQAKVYWDAQSIDWKDLADAVALFGSKAPEIAELFKQDPNYNHRADFLGDVEALSANRLVQTIGKVFRKADNEKHVERLLSLESLISELSAFNASRPHDIIYSVLSLANDTITSTTKPRKLMQYAAGRRLSLANKSHSRGASQHVENGALQPNSPRHDPALQLPDETITYSPLLEPQNNGYFDVMSDRWETSRAKIREFDFDEEQIEHAKKRVELYIKACPKDFNYDIMTQNLEVPNEERNIVMIPKNFWDSGSISWMQRGNQGLACLVLKLLQYEKGIVQDIFNALQNRVQFKKFHVDYKKKFYDVCKDFVNFTIRSSRSLDMLCRPWAPDKEDLPLEDQEEHDLPSWICPLSKSPFLPRPDGNFGRVNADLLVGMPNTGGTVYKASSNTRPPEQYFFGGNGGRRLFVTGMLVDTIRETATEAVEGNIPSSWLRLGGWTDNSKPPPESFWRTMVADRNEKGQNPPSYYQRACQFAFSQRTTRGSLNTERLINAKVSQVMTDYIKRVQAVVWMRKLIRTVNDDDSNAVDAINLGSRTSTLPQIVRTPTWSYSENPSAFNTAMLPNGEVDLSLLANSQPNEGRLGLVPYTARENDHICMLRGCSVPVIVRVLDEEKPADDRETQEQLRKLKVQATGNEWNHVVCKLIGECYVHGIMDGEIFKMRQERGLKDTIFEIL